MPIAKQFALACALGLATAVSAASPGERLRAEGDAFVLDEGFADLYDAAFVLTGGGGEPPRRVDVEALADALVDYDVVFFGEFHGHPGIHLQQQRLLRALHARHPRYVVSFEQFERDVQGTVDDYLAGRIGEHALRGDGRAWDNYPSSYRPLLEYARRNGLPALAAQAPTWAVRCIGQLGPEVLDAFTPAERAWVARDLHIDDGPYRERFFAFLGGSATHGGHGDGAQARQRSERSFAAQVARDDTMAESIQQALARHPGHRLLHLTGRFHSAGFLGAVERLRLREPALRIAVIDPVQVDDPAAPAFPRTALGEGTALLLVSPTPPIHVEGEDTGAWVHGIVAGRARSRCKYAPEDEAQAPPAAH